LGTGSARAERTASDRTNDPAAVIQTANAQIEAGVEMNAEADMAAITGANALVGAGTSDAVAQANPAKAENAGTNAHDS